jgi:hypothetical protein
MKPTRVISILLLSLVALFTQFPNGTIQAGDVIDFLPEVQAARSFEIFFLALISDFEIDCDTARSASELPNHLLVDNNGALRTEEESIILAAEAICLFFNFSLEASDTSFDPDVLAEIRRNRLEVLRGNIATYDDGTEIDGSKQLFRMAAAYGFFGAPDSLATLLADTPIAPICQVLQETILDGETLELRFVSMLILAFEIGDDLFRDSDDDSICGPLPTTSAEDLKPLVIAGDVNAAVDYASVIFADILTFIGDEPEPEELAQLEADLDRLEIEMLTNTGRLPLLTLANAPAIFILELAVDFIEGDFGN